jgi:polar amino acid transport system substrate-binding protein
MIPSKHLTFVTVLALAGCAGSTTVPQGPSSSGDSAGPAAVTADTGGAPVPGGGAAAGADAAPASSVLGFSAAQADRGRNVFRSTCTECHYSSEFSDRQFKFKWRRRTAGDLFGMVSTQMPEDAPGILDLQQYADIVAYVLRLNGFEPGSGELPPDEALLETLSLAPIGN